MKRNVRSETAFITGTGFYNLPGMESLGIRTMKTPYGEVEYENALFGSLEVTFIARHGKGHTKAPGQINYQANIFALWKMGIKRILATSVCGSLKKGWAPGTLVILNQFINFTSGRKESFYPMDGKLAHIDASSPYCPTLQHQLLQGAKRLGVKVFPRATYACTQGPRFETSAEIEMIRRLGGEIVGQTNYPECVLARELCMCYASVGVVSNLAAGVKSSALTAVEVTESVASSIEKVRDLFLDVITHDPLALECSCHHALDQAFL